MLNYFILGVIQGIVDWLPISSEGVLVIAQTWFFRGELGLSEMIQVALFIHLGSLLAVIVYFWKDILKLLKVFFHYKSSSKAEKSLLNFLIVSSLFTGSLGFFIFKSIENLEKGSFSFTGPVIMILIGALLLITSGMQFLAEKKVDNKLRSSEELKIKDAIIAGIVQSAAVLPGLSRSGSTVSTLLLLKIKDTEALKISFFMGLPVILGGNIILNYKFFQGGFEQFVGLFTAFVFGLLTIHFLMKVAEKLSFAWFTLFFGSLTLAAAFVSFLF